MSRYRAQFAPSYSSQRTLWSAIAEDGASLPFQHSTWLDAWARTKGHDTGVEMLAVTIFDADDRPVMALPLVRERGLVTRIAFADGGLTDYNAPILTSRTPQDAAGAQALWRALVEVLPPCDQILLERMPERIGGLANPLTKLPGVTPSATGGLALAMPDDFDTWLRAKPRRYRMELGRCARLFDALPHASFDVAMDSRGTVMDALENMQRERIVSLGRRYTLDGDAEQRFYRQMAEDRSGMAVVTTLRTGEESIAVLFGLRDAATFTMLRIGASSAHSNISPARQLIVRTMEHLRAEGVTHFDFGLGDYAYKRKLGGTPVALFDLTASRSLTGLVDTTRLRLKARLRRNPTLHAAAQRVATFTHRETRTR